MNTNFLEHIRFIEADNKLFESLESTRGKKIYYNKSSHEFKLWEGRQLNWLTPSLGSFTQKVLGWLYGGQYDVVAALDQIGTKMEQYLISFKGALADPNISLDERQELHQKISQLANRIQNTIINKVDTLTVKFQRILEGPLASLKQDLSRTHPLPLTEFPEEILLRMLSSLEVKDIFNASLAHPLFAKLLRDPSIALNLLEKKELEPEARLKLALFFGPSLKHLDLSKCPLKDQDLILLFQKCPNLISLNLDNVFMKEIDDAIIQAMATNLKQLTSLSLKKSTLGDTTIQAIAENLKQLTSLDISYCKLVGDAGIRVIAENLKQLTFLDIAGCWQVTTEGIQAVARNLKQLTSLDIAGCEQVTTEEIRAIAENLKQLTSLNILGCIITEEGTQILNVFLMESAGKLKITTQSLFDEKDLIGSDYWF